LNVIKVMKLIIVLTLFGTLHVSAFTFGQRLSIQLKRSAFEDVLQTVRKVSGYDVLYNPMTLSGTSPVTVDLNDVPLVEALEQIFDGQPVTFTLEKKTIVVRSRPPSLVRKRTRPLPHLTLVQNREVSGLVKDTTGQILSGVTVSVKGRPSIGTTTDLNGRYILSVPRDAVLVFNMIGFESQEISTSGREVIDVVLTESQYQIEETVVTAFGNRQRKSDLIGSVSSINPDELRMPMSNLTGAMQGKVAGMIAFQRSGEPGLDNADFFIRGVGTFGVNQRPLILVDNMEVTSDDLARIPVDDIESFSILRDATASAVYGSR